MNWLILRKQFFVTSLKRLWVTFNCSPNTGAYKKTFNFLRLYNHSK